MQQPEDRGESDNRVQRYEELVHDILVVERWYGIHQIRAIAKRPPLQRAGEWPPPRALPVITAASTTNIKTMAARLGQIKWLDKRLN
jgi:hypothetical protein